LGLHCAVPDRGAAAVVEIGLVVVGLVLLIGVTRESTLAERAGSVRTAQRLTTRRMRLGGAAAAQHLQALPVLLLVDLAAGVAFGEPPLGTALLGPYVAALAEVSQEHDEADDQHSHEQQHAQSHDGKRPGPPSLSGHHTAITPDVFRAAAVRSRLLARSRPLYYWPRHEAGSRISG